MMKTLMRALLLIFPLAVFAISGNAKQAVEEVKSGKAIFLDVREKDELVKNGSVQGAKNFNFSKVGTTEWDSYVATLPKDKKIYVFCQAGGRARKVADALNKRGLSAESAGGFSDLKNAGAQTQK